MSLLHRCGVALLFLVSAYAQEPLTIDVKGRLLAADNGFLDGYVVELESMATHTDTLRIQVSSDGEFSAMRVPSGDYMARVATLHGDTVTQQFVTINQQQGPLELRLPERPRNPIGATVSARELNNPPSRKAIDASIAAQRFSEAGKYDRAAAELEKAIGISPDYAAAHSNLGVQYMRIGRFAEAESEIRRSMEIAGPNPRDLSNLALAQLARHEFPEAMASARTVLKTERDAPGAHYVLGLALLRSPDTRAEGVAHLEEAAKTLDSAKRVLDSITH